MAETAAPRVRLIFAALLVLCVIGVTLFGAETLAEELVRRVDGRR